MLMALGMRAFSPIVAYILVGFVVGTIAQEFFRAPRPHAHVPPGITWCWLRCA
ncbi:MAG: hypothetical protein U5K74_14430 [Gemmatimonadaceae bacterium]|nr:hypothetical protein [Gemmatimonadaceae bacterium]